MGVFEIGWRWLGGVVRMGVVEAEDLHAALARLALYSDQFGGRDFEAFVSVADSDVLTGDNSVYMTFAGNQFSDENAAAFVGIGLFGVVPECVVGGMRNMQAQGK